MEYAVELEPKIKTEDGLRKPDIIATLGKTSIVLDGQVVSDKHDLDRADDDKVNYYKNNKTLTHEVKARYGSDTILFLGDTELARSMVQEIL